jgi:hypothetical protein
MESSTIVQSMAAKTRRCGSQQGWGSQGQCVA